MRRALFLVSLLVVSAGAAADTRKGYDAYTGGNFKAAVEEFRKSAQTGDALAMFYLGESYYNGKGVVQDFAEAIKWYSQSAEKGQVEAQETLGGLFFFGKGVKQDYAEAAKWYLKAADQGSQTAQTSIAQMYEYGRGVPQDYAEALKWFRKASAAGTDATAIAWAKFKITEVEAALAKSQTTAPEPSVSSHRVQLVKEGDTYTVPVVINNVLRLNFTVDGGAADVVISADVAETLIRAGAINKGDFVGDQQFTLADGSVINSKQFIIRSLKVGDQVIQNVRGSIGDVKGSLLLGQSFLEKFKSWSMDDGSHELVLG